MQLRRAGSSEESQGAGQLKRRRGEEACGRRPGEDGPQHADEAAGDEVADAVDRCERSEPRAADDFGKKSDGIGFLGDFFAGDVRSGAHEEDRERQRGRRDQREPRGRRRGEEVACDEHRPAADAIRQGADRKRRQ